MSNRVAQVEIIVFKMVKKIPLFLLLKRNLAKGGFWQPITGGVNFGENIDMAAKRELYEETGIDQYIKFIKDVYYFEFEAVGYGLTKEYVFGVQVEVDIDAVLSDEHTERRWCDLEDSLKLLKYQGNKEAFQQLYDSII